MIENPDLELTKKLLAKEKSPKIVRAQNQKYNRAILEYGNFDIFLANLKRKKQDTLKYLDLDLDKVSAKLASKKNISYCIDLKELRSLELEELSKELARLKETIKICKKTKTPLALLNASDKYNAKALLLSLGASTQQTAKALIF